MIGLLSVTMSEYSSMLNFSSGTGTSQAAWKKALKVNSSIQQYMISG